MSEPQIDVCLAQLPKGEKNPLSARARSSQVEKRTVKIGVGLLPYVWIGSVWQKRRPVITNLSAYRGRVSIDATSLRMVALDAADPFDTPEQIVIRERINCVNSLAHWQIITESESIKEPRGRSRSQSYSQIALLHSHLFLHFAFNNAWRPVVIMPFPPRMFP